MINSPAAIALLTGLVLAAVSCFVIVGVMALGV